MDAGVARDARGAERAPSQEPVRWDRSGPASAARWWALPAINALLAGLLALTLGSFAAAQPGEVSFDTGDDPDSRLEIRTVVLPDGSESELLVLTGDPAVVEIGDDRLSARTIELDVANSVVRVIGDGRFTSGGETIFGDDLTIRIDDEALAGRGVVIATERIDVRGDRASRVPGRIRVLGGAFSPCSRCDQAVEDYGFRAERLVLYPGDRLVAFEVTVLIRDVPVLLLPLLVLPLGPEDRQPSLELRRGTAAERARVAIAWPYVSGGDAYGTFRVRYEADVVPGEGGFVASQVLGGAVERSYLGGEIDHRYFTGRGSGELRLRYTPGYVQGDQRTEPELAFRTTYRSAPELDGPQIDVVAERDDARRRDLIEYRAQVEATDAGIRSTVTSRGFADLDAARAADATGARPSYDGAREPLRTPLRLRFAGEAPVDLGPVTLQRAELDLGVFEDQSNPVNRSAAARRTVSAGRVRVIHEERLEQSLWAGARLTGSNDFQGDYYDTGERQIAWSSRLGVQQRFGSYGSLALDYRRDTQEGETPFRFDSVALRGSSDLTGALQLTPHPWARLSVRGSYLLTDTRAPDEVGFQPIESRLDLFGPLRWIDLRLANSYDVAERDPGELDVTLRLRAPVDPLRLELEVDHTEDLAPDLPRRPGNDLDPDAAEAVDTSETLVRAVAGWPDVVELELEGGYSWAEASPRESSGDPPEPWRPLETAVVLGPLGSGSARAADAAVALPALRIAAERDLNAGEFTAVEARGELRFGPVEASAEQRVDLERRRIEVSRTTVRWPGIAEFRSDGPTLIDPAWLGIEIDPARRPHSWELRDARDDDVEWSVTYRATLDPRADPDDDLDPVWRDRTVDARLELAAARFAGIRLDLASRAVVQLADDRLPISYLRDLDLLRLGIDVGGVLGVQGALTYRGRYSAAADEFTSQRLAFDDLTVATRLGDTLVLGATLDDVWDLTGDDPARSPFNLQPRIFFAVDRCCWALYGSWDTETGAVSLTLTTPGAERGLGDTFDTPFTLPGRDPGAP